MSIKEKYQEYKEKQETKRYFRNHNDQFLNSSEWINTIFISLGFVILVGIILGLIVRTFHIESMILSLFAAYGLASVVTKVSGIHSKQMAFLSAGCMFICLIVIKMTVLFAPFYLTDFYLMGMWIEYSVKGVLMGGLYNSLINLFVLFVAYRQAQ